MLKEVIENIGLISGRDFADLTFGEGGHTEALLKNGARSVVAVDRDKEALEQYQREGKVQTDPRLSFCHSTFAEFVKGQCGPFDGVLMDLGVSTRQLLTPERGFSFREDAALDMRMDRSESVPTALELVLATPAGQIAHHLEIAGVGHPLRVAKELKKAAQTGRLETTANLAAFGKQGRPGRHPATNLFLGIRLMVNREFEEVEQAIPRIIDLLKPGGRLLIITFHSAEDRIVKRLFAMLSGKCICENSICMCPRVARVRPIFPKPLVPGQTELRDNPRSRSAKLRGVERVIENAPADE